MTISTRYALWAAGRDTGSSSLTMGAIMMGADPKDLRSGSHPRDPSDLGRCLRLLALIPEWRADLDKMRGVSPAWAALVDHWDELATLMADEVGIDWSKGKIAERTYDRMKEVLGRR